MPPLLLCSLGNPGAAYATTLHSAGHILLTSLRQFLASSPFSKDRSLGNGLVSSAPENDLTLWQSTSYMNESGRGVRSAYNGWIRQHVGGRLVVVHDELERPLGSITVRDGASKLSARGHNGIKSCVASLRGMGDEWVRVGVGIGRPASREPEDVARFVLRKMSLEERAKVEGAAVVLLEKLRELG